MKTKNPTHLVIALLYFTISMVAFESAGIADNAPLLAAARTQKKSQPEAGKSIDKPENKAKEKEPAETDEKKGEWIGETLEFGTQEERIKAVQKIQQIKNSGIKSRLANKLAGFIKEESDPEFLAKAIAALGEMKEKSAEPLLIEKMDHTSEDVRIAAVYALKSMNGVSGKEKMIKKLQEQNLENTSNFTEALLNTLGEFKAMEIVSFVKGALVNSKTHRGVKEQMILFIGKVQAKEAKEILLQLYKNEEEDDLIRAYAVNSLSKMGDADIAPQIKKIINDIESYDIKKRKKYHTLHLYSIAALAKLGDPDAVPKLVQALRSNSAETRLKAVNLIKEFKDKRTIDILKYKMKNDQNQKVRSAAKKALEEMGVDVKADKQ
jgi:HEAT repeat protein